MKLMKSVLLLPYGLTLGFGIETKTTLDLWPALGSDTANHPGVQPHKHQGNTSQFIQWAHWKLFNSNQ